MSSAEELPFKVGIHRRHEGIVEFRYADTFEIQEDGDAPRVLIAPADGHIELILRLMREMRGPYTLMYVLLAPYGKAEAGRYGITGIDENTVRAFMVGNRPFFEGDARHNLWVASESDGSMLVYDQHNVIYAYGPTEQFSVILRAQGMKEAETEFPYPHTHHFRSTLDRYEDQVLSAFEWQWSALQPEDES